MIPDRISVTVGSQNVLLDKGRTKRGLILPQDDRINGMAASIHATGESFDVFGVQEVYKSDEQHNGVVLAESLGYAESYWHEHNQPQDQSPADLAQGRAKKGRKHEYLGMFGNMVHDTKAIELGDNRLAVMTMIANVAFITLHLRAGGGDARNLRLQQALSAIEATHKFPDAVLLGDFNEPSVPFYSAARKALRDAGFVSASTATPNPERPPVTFPVPAYSDIMTAGHGRSGQIIKRGWPLDDILVRGDIAVQDTGTIEPLEFENDDLQDTHFATAPRVPTDHRGVWAKLSIKSINSSD